MTFLEDIQQEVRDAGIQDAVAKRDTPQIFDWLLTSFSYQGISDQVARTYINENGSASWAAIVAGLRSGAACHRLQSYRHFDRCRYDKTSFTCSEPERINTCPVPMHRLRNGRLNQTAYSFFLFVRDIAKNDLVSWIDRQLEETRNDPSALSGLANLPSITQERLIGPLRNVYGVSDKILTMTLSGLLLGASKGRPNWFKAGASMIAIDTLVHNFLHRTGSLQDCGRPHGYGVGCYAEGGCAEILRTVSSQIDAAAFNPGFPRVFPRFVQHAIWRYCAADGLDICNGNRIDDRKPCEIDYCQLFGGCARRRLKS